MKIVFDTETTGLSAETDEIIQLTMLDESGRVLFSDYFRPERITDWKSAETVNHITPEMVSNKQPIRLRINEIQQIFDKADEIIAYNISFDMAFLQAAGIDFSKNVVRSDPMIEFAEIYGEWCEGICGWKWQKLSKAASYYGYTLTNAHNAADDAQATLFIYNAMREKTQDKQKGRT